ncbi:MAG TPA: glycoside hydrolase family 44 protein, partial [Polyangiaceae bacterium]|nr:glycoside hydrolase family 44 protein [Polyangiaceae bacterium]
INLGTRLHSALKTKGSEDTGELNLARYVAGGRLDETWRRAVIPLSAFPDIERVELKGLQQVMFSVKADAPENRKVSVFVDDVYLTNAEIVTPVANLGYLVTAEGLELAWDKDPSEKLQHFSIALNGREVARAPSQARSHGLTKRELGAAPSTVSVTAVGLKESSEPMAVQVNPVAPPVVAATVALGKPAHDISPHVLGVNWASPSALREIGAGGNRWGGNRATKYNWKDDIDSAGSDWFFLNDHGVEPGTPETEKAYYRFVKETLGAKVPVNFTIPITPFIAKKHPTKGQRYCSFPTSLFPKQEKTDGQGCGNGRTPDGKPIRGNDPNLGMTKNSPELQREFVQTLVKHFGTAAKGGVQFYTLDNEPGLWMHTHRDSMPKGVSAEELVRFNLEYAAAVKAADPTAKVIGFAAWGVKELAGSNVDYFKEGAPDAYALPEEGSFQEVKKHGGDTQLVYFLKEAKKAEARAGKRLIDVIDVHWYHELWAKNSLGRSERTLNDVAYDPVFTPVQFEALREWWDPTFAPIAPVESWTYQADAGKDRLWRPYHPVIPALKALFEREYPGTRLAVNEYDNGSPEHFHGALLRAAALGFFMREDLYMAQNWHQTGRDRFTYFAQKLYGNYDGRGAKVGGKYVPATSSQAELYAFGAKRGATTTVVVVNRNRTTAFDLTLDALAPVGKVRTFTLAESLGLRLLERTVKSGGRTVKVNVPPFSAMLVELG